MRRLRLTVLAAFVVLVCARTAQAVGPSLPAVDGGVGITVPGTTTSYVAKRDLLAGQTTLRAQQHGVVLRTSRLHGAWGVQLATLGGALTGLSPNGRVLVLTDNVEPQAGLRPRSRFAVVDTRTLALRTTISLRGDYAVDALSPNGRYLYLIHHVSAKDATKYQVRGYDLRAHALLPGVIADKSQAGWTMAGWPITRAATKSGGWVYTLYRQDHNYPFVHALDTITHTAVCIGVPADWTRSPWISTARLALANGKLEIRGKDGRTHFMLDTATFEVSTP